MSHFNGGSMTRSEPKFAARHCSECGHELYADEELICQECEKKLSNHDDSSEDFNPI